MIQQSTAVLGLLGAVWIVHMCRTVTNEVADSTNNR